MSSIRNKGREHTPGRLQLRETSKQIEVKVTTFSPMHPNSTNRLKNKKTKGNTEAEKVERQKQNQQVYIKPKKQLSSSEQRTTTDPKRKNQLEEAEVMPFTYGCTYRT